MLEERQCIPSDPNLVNTLQVVSLAASGGTERVDKDSTMHLMTSERMLVSSDSCDSTHLCDAPFQTPNPRKPNGRFEEVGPEAVG